MPLSRFTPPYRIHLGCNLNKVDGFINVDVRETAATDLVHDCGNLSAFPDDSVEVVFSNAFFEHLYLNQRGPLLADVRRVLRPGGCIFFTGLPDFEIIARSYLARAPGLVSPVFDLYEAYRFTHGDPEGQPDWWLAQLHKGLLDQHELRAQLLRAGFDQPCVFRYAYKNESIALNLGFAAVKNGAVSQDMLKQLIGFFAPLTGTTSVALLSPS